MILKFNDRPDLKDINVLFIYGKHGIFNNMLSDDMRRLTEPSDAAEVNAEIADEFGLSDLGYKESNRVDIEEFLENCYVPPFDGQWFCRVRIKGLSKRLKEGLWAYIKKPSAYARMVVDIDDFKTYLDCAKNNIIKRSKNVGICNTSYPSRDILKSIVKEKAGSVLISDNALVLFMIRMGSDYDNYGAVLDQIKDSGLSRVDIKEMKTFMRGIANYSIDAFVDMLLKAPSGIKYRKTKLNEAYGIISTDYEPRQLVKAILRKLDMFIEYRTLVNKGLVPMNAPYSVKTVKDKLGDDSGVKGVNDWRFKMDVRRATTTSLKDLVYMKSMLKKAEKENTDFAYEKAMVAVISRLCLREEQIFENMGIKTQSNLYELNSALVRAVET